MQRLLWEIGGSVAFGPPTVEQLRNAHNLMRDFRDEEPLYSQAGNLVNILNAWSPPEQSDLPEMMISLAQLMADENMWEQVSIVPSNGSPAHHQQHPPYLLATAAEPHMGAGLRVVAASGMLIVLWLTDPL